MKILSWNIVSIRKFSNFKYISLDTDIIAIQEIKYNNVDDLKANYKLEGYFDFWSVSKKPGYSGCGLYVKVKPYHSIVDNDGRYIILYYDNFFIVNTYVMNAGEKLKNLNNRLAWDLMFRSLLNDLIIKHKKEIILIGDMNCAHQPIDVKNPLTKLKSPGYSVEERESFNKLLETLNLIDTFRYLNPNSVKYSYFSYRNNARKNHSGWRLDYILISKGLLNNLIS